MQGEALIPDFPRVSLRSPGVHPGYEGRPRRGEPNMKLGIYLNSQHRERAEIGAFLDLVSGGKFLLGVGLGYRGEEFAAFGVPMSERVSRLTEGVEIIRRLWTEDKVTHRGRHWSFENVTIRPRPIQWPRPPILVGSQVPT